MLTPEIQRIILIVGLVTTGYLMMMAWQEDHRRQPESARIEAPTVTETKVSSGHTVPLTEDKGQADLSVQDGMFSDVPFRSPSSSATRTARRSTRCAPRSSPSAARCAAASSPSASSPRRGASSGAGGRARARCSRRASSSPMRRAGGDCGAEGSLPNSQ